MSGFYFLPTDSSLRDEKCELGECHLLPTDSSLRDEKKTHFVEMYPFYLKILKKINIKNISMAVKNMDILDELIQKGWNLKDSGKFEQAISV